MEELSNIKLFGEFQGGGFNFVVLHLQLWHYGYCFGGDAQCPIFITPSHPGTDVFSGTLAWLLPAELPGHVSGSTVIFMKIFLYIWIFFYPRVSG